MDDGVGSGVLLDVEYEIEGDFGERRIKAARVDRCLVGGAARQEDQTIAGGKGKVVVQVFIAVDADLSNVVSSFCVAPLGG